MPLLVIVAIWCPWHALEQCCADLCNELFHAEHSDLVSGVTTKKLQGLNFELSAPVVPLLLANCGKSGNCGNLVSLACFRTCCDLCK